LQRTFTRLEQDRPIFDEVAEALDDIFMDPESKRKWAKAIAGCLRAKAKYEKQKAAGKKVKPEDDPLPLRREAYDDPGKHMGALMTILGVWHRRYGREAGAVVTKRVLAIWPEIARSDLIIFPHGRFLKWALKHVRMVAERGTPSMEAVASQEENKAEGTEPSGQPAEGSEKEFRFGENDAQAFFNNEDLEVPAGRCVKILRLLKQSMPDIVKHADVNEAADQPRYNSAEDCTRECVLTVNKALKKHRVPFKVEARRGAGYVLVRAKSSKKKTPNRP
jgi:hypothetical protein